MNQASHGFGSRFAGRSELSRRAVLDAMEALAEHHDAITLVGAHAVMLRTESLGAPMSDTGDGDLGLSPGLVADSPAIGKAMLDSKWELRTSSRPGLWGKGRREHADGSVVWDYQVDLIVGSSIAGRLRSQQRSVPALSGAHGKMATGNTPGIDLSSVSRSRMWIPDLMDPGLGMEMYVASSASLIVAKAYKLGERLDQGGARLRDKDAGDLWALMATNSPGELLADIDQASRTLGAQLCDEMLGRVRQVVGSPHVEAMAIRMVDAFGSTSWSPGATFDTWRNGVACEPHGPTRRHPHHG